MGAAGPPASGSAAAGLAAAGLAAAGLAEMATAGPAGMAAGAAVVVMWAADSPEVIVLPTTNSGRPFTSSKIRAMYSPWMPFESSSRPLKNSITIRSDA